MEIFVQQLKDVTEEIRWQERRTLVQSRMSLGGTARIYSRGETAEEIYTALISSYGISPQQAKERLLELSRDPQGSGSDFEVEIGHLVKLVHRYLPTTERDLLTIEYLMRSLGTSNCRSICLPPIPLQLQAQLHATESYLVIDNAGRLAS